MRIRVRCTDCGEMLTEPDAVTLRNCVDSDTWSYRFRCPRCARVTAAPITRQSAFDAATAGVEVEMWTLPAGSSPTGPAFTAVDVMALRAALLEPDWFETLLAVDAG
jgi:hypothetical protein